MQTEFDQWFKTSSGYQIVKREVEILSMMTEGLFGYYLLQLGGNEIYFDGFDREILKRRFIVGGQFPDVKAELEYLPIASDSVDAILLPHTLDFAQDRIEVLREVERLLIPEGTLFICGINPWSPKRWHQHRRFISYLKLVDWLSLLGFDLDEPQFVASWPGTMEKWGAKYLPWFSSVYIVKAIKRVSTVTPMRPKWQLVSKNGATVPEVSARTMKRN